MELMEDKYGRAVGLADPLTMKGPLILYWKVRLNKLGFVKLKFGVRPI